MTGRFPVSLGVSLGALAVLSLAGSAAAQTDGKPVHFSAGQLRQMVAKTKDGLAASPLPTGEATVIMVRRDRTGDVELHMAHNDVFVAHDGRATVMIGGTVAGDHETSPGEFKGGKLSGAKPYPMAPGDVVWIPAGIPHQVVVPAHKAFEYLALKYPSAKKP
jgi:mannose-6-phosphate isomerase-like protein (cupin superfamily)